MLQQPDGEVLSIEEARALARYGPGALDGTLRFKMTESSASAFRSRESLHCITSDVPTLVGGLPDQTGVSPTFSRFAVTGGRSSRSDSRGGGGRGPRAILELHTPSAVHSPQGGRRSLADDTGPAPSTVSRFGGDDISVISRLANSTFLANNSRHTLCPSEAHFEDGEGEETFLQVADDRGTQPITLRQPSFKTREDVAMQSAAIPAPQSRKVESNFSSVEGDFVDGFAERMVNGGSEFSGAIGEGLDVNGGRCARSKDSLRNLREVSPTSNAKRVDLDMEINMPSQEQACITARSRGKGLRRALQTREEVSDLVPAPIQPVIVSRGSEDSYSAIAGSDFQVREDTEVHLLAVMDDIVLRNEIAEGNKIFAREETNAVEIQNSRIASKLPTFKIADENDQPQSRSTMDNITSRPKAAARKPLGAITAEKQENAAAMELASTHGADHALKGKDGFFAGALRAASPTINTKKALSAMDDLLPSPTRTVALPKQGSRASPTMVGRRAREEAFDLLPSPTQTVKVRNDGEECESPRVEGGGFRVREDTGVYLFGSDSGNLKQSDGLFAREDTDVFCSEGGAVKPSGFEIREDTGVQDAAPHVAKFTARKPLGAISKTTGAEGGSSSFPNGDENGQRDFFAGALRAASPTINTKKALSAMDDLLPSPTRTVALPKQGSRASPTMVGRRAREEAFDLLPSPTQTVNIGRSAEVLPPSQRNEGAAGGSFRVREDTGVHLFKASESEAAGLFIREDTEVVQARGAGVKNSSESECAAANRSTAGARRGLRPRTAASEGADGIDSRAPLLETHNGAESTGEKALEFFHGALRSASPTVHTKRALSAMEDMLPSPTRTVAFTLETSRGGGSPTMVGRRAREEAFDLLPSPTQTVSVSRRESVAAVICGGGFRVREDTGVYLFAGRRGSEAGDQSMDCGLTGGLVVREDTEVLQARKRARTEAPPAPAGARAGSGGGRGGLRPRPAPDEVNERDGREERLDSSDVGPDFFRGALRAASPTVNTKRALSAMEDILPSPTRTVAVAALRGGGSPTMVGRRAREEAFDLLPSPTQTVTVPFGDDGGPAAARPVDGFGFQVREDTGLHYIHCEEVDAEAGGLSGTGEGVGTHSGAGGVGGGGGFVIREDTGLQQCAASPRSSPAERGRCGAFAIHVDAIDVERGDCAAGALDGPARLGRAAAAGRGLRPALGSAAGAMPPVAAAAAGEGETTGDGDDPAERTGSSGCEEGLVTIAEVAPCLSGSPRARVRACVCKCVCVCWLVEVRPFRAACPDSAGARARLCVCEGEGSFR